MLPNELANRIVDKDLKCQIRFELVRGFRAPSLAELVLTLSFNGKGYPD